MTIQTDLGRRIRELRTRMNLTLKDIEARVDVSATHVSEIERGKTSPTVGALARIAEALRVEPSRFLGGDDLPDHELLRAGEQLRVAFARDQCEMTALSAPVRGQDLSAGLMRWAPMAQEPPLRSYEGEHFISVLEGELLLEIGNERVLLRPGDCVHYRASRPHRLLNAGTLPCVGLWASSPKFGV